MTDPAPQPTPAPAPAAAARRGAAPRARVLLAAAGGLAVAAVALLGAWALNSPVGEGEADQAPAMPAAVGGVNPGTAAGLPPLALVLDRPAPDGISDLPAAQQVERLRAVITDTSPARRHVELGVALQAMADNAQAQDAYREALRRDPDDLAARIGLALVPAASGGEREMATAAAELEDMRRPGRAGQIVDFNRAWLEIYRGDAAAAQEALEQTVAAGDSTPLGRTASTLLAALNRGSTPTP